MARCSSTTTCTSGLRGRRWRSSTTAPKWSSATWSGPRSAASTRSDSASTSTTSARPEDFWALPYQLERCRYDLGEYCDRCRGEAPRAAGQARARGRLGSRARGRARRDPRAVPLGLPARLGALDRRPRRRLSSRASGRQHAVEEVWALYARELEAAARSGHFDVLAHPDLVKIFGDRVDWDWQPVIDALDGVALEVSTAGLHKPVGELYPEAALLRGAKPDHARVRRTPRRERRPRLRGCGRARPCRRVRDGDGVRRALVAPGAARVNDYYRVGIGVDAHALVEGERLVLGGVEIPFAARARRALRRRRDHARVDRRDPRRGRPRRHRGDVPVGRPALGGRLVDRPARAGVRRRAVTRPEARERRLHPDRRGAAPRAAPEQMRERIAGRSTSTRSGSRCVRRRWTGSASRAATRGSPHRRSRCYAGRRTVPFGGRDEPVPLERLHRLAVELLERARRLRDEPQHRCAALAERSLERRLLAQRLVAPAARRAPLSERTVVAARDAREADRPPRSMSAWPHDGSKLWPVRSSMRRTFVSRGSTASPRANARTAAAV